MQISRPSFAMIMAALLAFNVHATPDKVSDNTEAPASDKGLFTQLDQVTQNVGLKASSLVNGALGLVGVPYRRGGSTAESGFDCSGFVRSVYKNSVGLLLPRKAEEQASATQHIRKKDLKPGDLVFFNTMRHAFSHVGIYVGEGKFIHSPKPGSRVRIDSMDMDYWQGRFNGARRVPSTTGLQLKANAPLEMAVSLLDTAPAAPLESLESLEPATSLTALTSLNSLNSVASLTSLASLAPALPSTSVQATGPLVIPVSKLHSTRTHSAKTHNRLDKRTEKTKKQEKNKLKKQNAGVRANKSASSKSSSSRAKKRAK